MLIASQMAWPLPCRSSEMQHLYRPLPLYRQLHFCLVERLLFNRLCLQGSKSGNSSGQKMQNFKNLSEILGQNAAQGETLTGGLEKSKTTVSSFGPLVQIFCLRDAHARGLLLLFPQGVPQCPASEEGRRLLRVSHLPSDSHAASYQTTH